MSRTAPNGLTRSTASRTIVSPGINRFVVRPDRSVPALDLVPAVETLIFVRRYLPRPASRILEVGCGGGEMASLLLGLGHSVTALDQSTEAVDLATALGVRARRVSWPEFDDQPFDAVLFTRSLHHIHPLDKALRRAAQVLAGDGRLVVEDFAREEIDPRTDRWFRTRLARLESEGALKDVHPTCFATRVLERDAGVEAWYEAHDHDLHTAASIESEMRKEFQINRVEPSPYLYRYALPLLRNDLEGFRAVKRWIAEESQAIQAGEIVALGRRFVASHRN